MEGTASVEIGLDSAGLGEWWQALVELYREEARHSGTAARACAHLSEAARIQAEHLLDPEAARRTYEEAHDASPDDPGPIRALAELAVRAGKWSAARRWLERALAMEPEGAGRVAPLVELAGVLQDHLGARSEAVRLLREASLLAPDDPSILARLAIGLDPGDRAGQIDLLRRRIALAESPRVRATLHLELGRLLEGDPDGDAAALAECATALELDPTTPGALESSVRVHLRLGRWEELAQALMAGASHVEDQAARGRLLYLCALLCMARLGAPEQARIPLGQVAMLLTDDPTVVREVAADFEQLGMWGPANTVLESLARLVPEEWAAAVWYRAGLNAEVGARQTGRALTCYGRALEHDPHHLPALWGMRRCAWRSEDIGVYGRALESLADNTPDPLVRAALLSHSGDILSMRLGDEPGARTQYLAAVDVSFSSPESQALPDALPELCRLLSRAGDFHGLRDVLSRALDAGLDAPGAGWVHDALASLYEARLKRPELAVRHAEQALAVDPRNIGALRVLQRALATRGDRAGLVAALRREGDDETVHLHRRLAALTRAAEEATTFGDPAAAEEAWRAALDLQPDWLPSLRGLGRLYFQHGRWRESADLLRHELKALPEDAGDRPRALGKLGELLEFRLGEPDGAARCYEAVLDLRPDAPDALAGLERLYGGMERWDDLARVLAARARHIEDPRERAALLFRLGEIRHEHQRDLDEALDAYESAMELDPELAPASWALERLVVELHERERLVMLYRTVLPRLRTDGQRATTAHKLAALLPPVDARVILEERASRDPDAVWGLVRDAAEVGDRVSLGARLARFAQFAGARRDAVAFWREAAEWSESGGAPASDRIVMWERVLPLAPAASRPWEALLNACELAEPGELSGVLARFARTTDDDRARSVALWRAGLLEDAAGHGATAVELYGEARDACEADPLPLALLYGRAVDGEAPPLDAGARARLLQALAGRLASGPEAARRLFEAGCSLADEVGDKDRALQAFVEAVRRDPTADAAADRASELLDGRRGYEELAGLLKRRIRRLEEPGRLLPLLRRLADVQLGALGDRAGAAQTLARIVALDPEDREARRGLADHLYASERWADAAEQYALLTADADKEADLVHLWTRLGQLKAHHLDDLTGAIEDLRRAVGLLDPDGRALEELAAVYLRADEPDLSYMAYQRLEKVADDHLRTAAARTGQVRAMLARGRRAEAIAELARFRELDPVDPMLAALARDLDAGAPTEPRGPAEELLPAESTDQTAVLAAVRLRKVPTPVALRAVGPMDLDSEPDSAPPSIDPDLDAPPAVSSPTDPPTVEQAIPPIGLAALDEEPGYNDTGIDLDLALLDEVMPEPPSLAPSDPPPAPAPPEPDVRHTMPYGQKFVPTPPPLPPQQSDPPTPPTAPDGGATETGMPVLVLGGSMDEQPLDVRREALSGPPTVEQSTPPMPAAEVQNLAGQAADARSRIARDPLDDAAWGALAASLDAPEKGAVASWLRGLRAWLGGEVRPSIPAAPRGALPNELREALLPPSVPVAVLRLLRAVGPTIAGAFTAGRRSGEAVGPREGLHVMARRIGLSLGAGEFEVERNAARPYTVTVEVADGLPVVVLGNAIVSGADDAGRSFLLARCLVALREGTLPSRKLSDREFRAFLGALTDLLGASYEVRARDRATFERLRRDLEPALSDGNLEWSALAADAAESLGRLAPATVRAGLELYTARLALALADGFGGAFEMLRLLDFDDRPRSTLGRPDLEQFLADSETARDLMVFACSPECLAVRRWLAAES